MNPADILKHDLICADPASLARTAYQETLYALEDWQCYPDPFHAWRLLVCAGAMQRIDPAFTSKLAPILITDETLRACVSALDLEKIPNLDEINLAYWGQYADPNNTEETLVDSACSFWEAIRDALDASRVIGPYDADLAESVGSYAKNLANMCYPDFTRLSPSRDLALGDAATMNPALVDAPEMQPWVRLALSCVLFFTEKENASWEREGEKLARYILDIAKKAREKA
jgi:hypothetical protein